MALAPCHAFFQFYVADGKLSCQLYQRSRRTCSSASRSTSPRTRCSRTWSPQQTGLEVGDFVWTGGDCHIYDNHVEQVREQLAATPYPCRR